MKQKTYTLLLQIGDLSPIVQSNLTAREALTRLLSKLDDPNSSFCKSATLLDHEYDNSFRLDWGEIDADEES